VVAISPPIEQAESLGAYDKAMKDVGEEECLHVV
jgi:hypothetical protein